MRTVAQAREHGRQRGQVTMRNDQIEIGRSPRGRITVDLHGQCGTFEANQWQSAFVGCTDNFAEPCDQQEVASSLGACLRSQSLPKGLWYRAFGLSLEPCPGQSRHTVCGGPLERCDGI